jgi:LuxR family maltose regulon positive regulatory protein
VVAAAETLGPHASLADIVDNVAPASYRAPTGRPGLIPRSELVARLCDAASTDQTIVIRAPGGFGKTSTIVLWSSADDRPFAWVHLDVIDNDPVHLLQHIGLALDHVRPVDPHTAGVLTQPGRSITTYLLPALARELDRRSGLVLVLDDVHVLTSEGSARVIDGLMANLPAGVQLVLSGRSMSAFSLARRRMDGRLLELSSADLSMTVDDATLLLEAEGSRLTVAEVQELHRATEGWPGGLHLAALAMERQGPDALDTNRISGPSRFLVDYLVEEVLEGLTAETVSFLLQSSVLDRMSAPDLDALLERDDSAARLEDLERTGNLFLIPLDEQRNWYRYHHLFAETLRARLHDVDPAIEAQLHLGASRILEARHDVDGAIRHALAGGHTSRAADLVLSDAHALAMSGRASRLGQRIDLIDASAPDAADDVSIAMARAWFAVATGDTELFAGGLAVLERRTSFEAMSDGTPSTEVAAALLRAVAGAWGLEEVVRDTEVVRRAGRTGNPWWGLATCIQGAACTLLDRPDDARRLLVEGLPSVTTPSFEANVHAQIALLDLRAGDLAEADRRVARALAIVERDHLETVLPSGVALAVGSLVAARHARFEPARELLIATQRLLAQLGDLSPRMSLLCYLILAQSALACAKPALARAMAAEAQRSRPLVGDATALHAQLDEVVGHLDQGAGGDALELVPLTEAELRILSYLPTHLSLQQIADEVFISRNTAKSHSVAIYRKLGVSARNDAVRVARQAGLLDI